jgi:hypothetical protein
MKQLTKVLGLLGAVFFAFSAAAFHLGPITPGGNCGTVCIIVDVYDNGSLVLANFQGQCGVARGTPWPNATGIDFPNSDVPGSGHVTTYRIRITGAGPTGSDNYTDPNIFSADDTAAGTVAGSVGACGTNDCMATNLIYSFTATNNTADYQMWVAELDGTPLCGALVTTSGGTGTAMIIPPGQTKTMKIGPILTGCGFASGAVTFVPWDYQGWSSCGGTVPGSSVPLGAPAGTGHGPTTITTLSGGGAGGTGSGGNNGTSGSGPGSPVPVYDPTNSPINFNPTNSPGTNAPPTDGTLQAGFGALYDAINRNGAANVEKLLAIDADIRGTTAAVGSLSNGLGALQNQGLYMSNMMSTSTNLLSKVTNMLQLQLTLSTNGYNGISNAVLTSGANITNWLGFDLASNLANARMLSNTIQGVSNAVVWSGTNSSLFLSNSFFAVMNGLTNLGGNFSGSNTFTDVGASNATYSFHHDATNLLGQLLDTNIAAYATIHPGDIGASGTNYDAAVSALGSAMDGPRGTIDANIADAETLDGATLPSGGSSGLTMAFAGTTLNLDPDAIAPGVTDFVYYLTELIVIIFFYISASKLYMWSMATLSSLRTGGVPNLTAEVFGIGGNLLGLAVHPAICAAVVTVFVGVLTAVVGRLPSAGLISASLGHVASASTGPAASTAWYLLQKTIPIPLILSLTATRIALQFQIGNLIIFAAGVMRFFIGSGS